MKLSLLILIVMIACNGFSQLNSGVYDGLNVVCDASNQSLKGFFYAESGYSEETDESMFSCGFYFESTASKGNEYTIKSFWPGSLESDMIQGQITVIDASHFSMKLDEEHGGCWNVAHFADTASTYSLEEKRNWIDIRYAAKDKVHFYNAKEEAQKRKGFVVKNDVVYIEKKEGNWAYCIYYGEKAESKGWMKLEELSK